MALNEVIHLWALELEKLLLGRIASRLGGPVYMSLLWQIHNTHTPFSLTSGKSKYPRMTILWLPMTWLFGLTRPSSATVHVYWLCLMMQVLALHEEGYQLPVPSQCQEMRKCIENANMFLYFLLKIQQVGLISHIEALTHRQGIHLASSDYLSPGC